MPLTYGPQLRRIMQAMKGVQRDAYARAVRAAGQEALSLVQEGLQLGVDVNGRPFKPVARSGRPLLDTGRLRNSIRLVASSRSFRLVSPLKYARLQNQGGVVKAKRGGYLKFKVNGKWVQVRQVRIARRQYMPFGGEMPRRWAVRVRAAALRGARSAYR